MRPACGLGLPLLLAALVLLGNRGLAPAGEPVAREPVAGASVPEIREVCIDPVSGTPGSRVSPHLVVSDGEGIAGFQVDLRYDALAVALVAVRPGPDTASVPGWSVEGNLLGEGTVRVLGFSSPPAALGPKPKAVATIDFEVRAQEGVSNLPLPLGNCTLGDVNGLPIPCAICLQPGVDIALPRFSVTRVDDSLVFQPARVAVEQGEWAIWRHDGAFELHTTTSGSPCSPDGLWDADLLPLSRFVRRFFEEPGQLPYFCRPHCSLGMVGEVVVVPPIRVSPGESSGAPTFAWQGGSGVYRVFRSEDPAFFGIRTEVFLPDGGPGDTAFTDPTAPAPGRALFYLVKAEL